jgi:hypothetical protein
MERIVLCARSSCSSATVDLELSWFIRAAMFPKMKAATTAPVMMIIEDTAVYVVSLGAISLPIIVRMA